MGEMRYYRNYKYFYCYPILSLYAPVQIAHFTGKSQDGNKPRHGWFNCSLKEVPGP